MPVEGARRYWQTASIRTVMPAPAFAFGTSVRLASPSRLTVALFGLVTLPVIVLAVRVTTFGQSVAAAVWSAETACTWTLIGAAVQPAAAIDWLKFPFVSVVVEPTHTLAPEMSPAVP